MSDDPLAGRRDRRQSSPTLWVVTGALSAAFTVIAALVSLLAPGASNATLTTVGRWISTAFTASTIAFGITTVAIVIQVTLLWRKTLTQSTLSRQEHRLRDERRVDAAVVETIGKMSHAVLWEEPAERVPLVPPLRDPELAEEVEKRVAPLRERLEELRAQIPQGITTKDLSSTESRILAMQLETIKEAVAAQTAAIQKQSDDSLSFLEARVAALESKQLTKGDIFQTVAIMLGFAAGLLALVSALIGAVIILAKFFGLLH